MKLIGTIIHKSSSIKVITFLYFYNQYKNGENNIYQITTTIKYLQPFYTITSLLLNGMYCKTNNIVNDHNVVKISSNLQFNVHGVFMNVYWMI